MALIIYFRVNGNDDGSPRGNINNVQYSIIAGALPAVNFEMSTIARTVIVSFERCLTISLILVLIVLNRYYY